MFSARRIEPEAEPAPTVAAIASKVRVPAQLQMARRAWRELQRQHDALQAELRGLIVSLDATPAQHEREMISRRVGEIDKKIGQLGGKVRAALAAITDATPAFTRSIEDALGPVRAAAAKQAIGAIDTLAAAMATLTAIDNELRPLSGGAWELRRLAPDLGNLRRRILGLSQ